MRTSLRSDSGVWVLEVQRDADFYRIKDGSAERVARADLIDDRTLLLEVDGQRRRVVFARRTDSFVIAIDGAVYTLTREQAGSGHPHATHVVSPEIVAPMPGKVIQVLVKPGDLLAPGDTLLILEAMKMENRLLAEAAGTVEVVNVKPGDLVDGGEVLAVVRYDEDGASG